MKISGVSIITLDEPHISDFAQARNQAMAKATTDWVLLLDKDEQLSSELIQEIKHAISSSLFVAYRLSRIDTFLGHTLLHGETATFNQVRLVKKTAGHWVRPVHEIWVSNDPTSKVGDLRVPLSHHPHPTISSFLSKINRYSSIDAEYRYHQGIHSSFFHILTYPVGKFCRNYLFLSGYRDGIPGLIMAIMMSFHSFLTWSKLYILWHKK